MYRAIQESGFVVFGSETPIYVDTLNVLVNGGTFLGLLLAGILLLRKKKAGRTVTLILAVAVPILTVILAILTGALLVKLPTLGQSATMRTSTLIGVFIGSTVRALYPVIAGAVLLPRSQELGLDR